MLFFAVSFRLLYTTTNILYVLTRYLINMSEEQKHYLRNILQFCLCWCFTMTRVTAHFPSETLNYILYRTCFAARQTRLFNMDTAVTRNVHGSGVDGFMHVISKLRIRLKKLVITREIAFSRQPSGHRPGSNCPSNGLKCRGRYRFHCRLMGAIRLTTLYRQR